MTDVARTRIEENLKKYLEKPNKGRNGEIKYEIGQYVYVRNRVQSDKAQGLCMSFAPKYKGPYKIIEILSKEVLVVETAKDKTSKVHVQDVKPAHEPGSE